MGLQAAGTAASAAQGSWSPPPGSSGSRGSSVCASPPGASLFLSLQELVAWSSRCPIGYIGQIIRSTLAWCERVSFPARTWSHQGPCGLRGSAFCLHPSCVVPGLSCVGPCVLPRHLGSRRTWGGLRWPKYVLASPQVSIDCPWSIYSTVIALTFSVPFRTTHALLSAGTRYPGRGGGLSAPSSPSVTVQCRRALTELSRSLGSGVRQWVC